MICAIQSALSYAEAGVPDHVMESISGYLSRRMLEHYSRVRLQAKREALDALEARREARFEEIASKSSAQRGTASQFPSHYLVDCDADASKLLIYIMRRDGRVAEGARLESVYTRKGIQGSNPCLSAMFSIPYKRRHSVGTPLLNYHPNYLAICFPHVFR